jgi:ubiquinone/menaquinone biosynthesis C-methylase UbiE
MNADFVYFIAPDSLDGSLCTFGLSAMHGETEALQTVARSLRPTGSLVVLDASRSPVGLEVPTQSLVHSSSTPQTGITKTTSSL